MHSTIHLMVGFSLLAFLLGILAAKRYQAIVSQNVSVIYDGAAVAVSILALPVVYFIVDFFRFSVGIYYAAYVIVVLVNVFLVIRIHRRLALVVDRPGSGPKE